MLIDLTEKVFGRLRVLCRGDTLNSRTIWVCLCSCGNTSYVEAYSLKNGLTTSCGCFQKEQTSKANTTHGYFGTRTYSSWSNMHQRCTNAKGYTHLSVCSRWSDFENFLEDMGVRPEGLTLDRRDNKKGYYPENCHWATAAEQARNRTYCRYLTDGTTIRTIAEWSRILGLPRTTMYRNADKGILPETLSFCNTH